MMWLRFAYGQTWQDGTAKGEAKVIRYGEQSPYKKRDAKVIWDKDKEIEIDYFNGKFKRVEARRLSKKLEGYEGENYELEIDFEQGNYFLGEKVVLESEEKRERGYAGFYDWRIPTVEESKTLVTNTNSDIFPNSSFVEDTDTCFRLVRGQQNSILPTSKADIFDEEIIASLIFLNAIDIYEKNKNQKLVRKYRTNSAGIRNDGKARKLCLKCGSSDNIEYSYFYEKCKTCGTSWYVNHCWKCKKMVDERDSETPKCEACGWCKCTCGACRLGCTSK
ncbi:MAG: hypothetical protein QX189_08710 [Methylococcales bacterium]